MVVDSGSTRRKDGRSANTLRPLTSSLSILSRADGSAKYTSGNTSILAAVYGPIAPRNEARSNRDIATVSCIFPSKRTHASSMSNQEGLEQFVSNTLSSCICVENYPRSMIEIVFEVLTSDGSVLSSAIQAGVLALMDAGIQMKQIPVAITCLVDPSGQENGDDYLMNILLDPTAEEEERENCGTVVIVNGWNGENGNDIISTYTKNFVGTRALSKHILACMELASRASGTTVNFMRIVIKQKVEREGHTLWST